MYFEVCYLNDLLIEVQDKDMKDIQSILEGLFDTHDEAYGLSDAYDDAAEWVTDLTLTPVYRD